MTTNLKLLSALIQDATEANCTIVLEAMSTGVRATFRTNTTIPNVSSTSRLTEITIWLDRNDPQVEHAMVKAYRSLP